MQTEIYQPVLDALRNFGVSPDAAEHYAKQVTLRKYEAKRHVFSEGDRQPAIAFVRRGYMRMYVTDGEGDVSTRLLAGPGQFIGCIVNTLYDSPAQYTAECITDCELIVVNKNVVDSAKGSPSSRVVLQDIILQYLVSMMQEKAVMLPMKATDRYLFFRDRYPELMERIPAGIIANYIGVRPQSLSRIKQMLK